MKEILKYQGFNVEVEKSDNELIEFWGNRLGFLNGIDDKNKKIEMANIFEKLAKYIIKNNTIDLPVNFPNDIIDLGLVSFAITRRIYQTCGTFYEDYSEYFKDLINGIILIHNVAKNFNENNENIDIEAEYATIVSDIVTCDLLRRKNNC